MSSSQKFSKKEFSLSQYYSQLERYEGSFTGAKHTPLKKDSSLSSLTKDKSNTTYMAKTYKDQLSQDKPKLDITNKYSSKISLQQYDRSKLQNFKKNSALVQTNKPINFGSDSLATSSVTCKKWLKDSRNQQKQNIAFSKKDQQQFVEHCQQLYNIDSNDLIVADITRQINKRDQVYQVVSEHFGSQDEQSYSTRLQSYFAEHQLMRKVIEQFKSISKLQTSDLSELYYFLKSDG